MNTEKILMIFETAGVRIELGATFSAKGQLAQLLNASEAIIRECATVADTTEFSGAEGTEILNAFDIEP